MHAACRRRIPLTTACIPPSSPPPFQTPPQLPTRVNALLQYASEADAANAEIRKIEADLTQAKQRVRSGVGIGGGGGGTVWPARQPLPSWWGRHGCNAYTHVSGCYIWTCSFAVAGGDADCGSHVVRSCETRLTNDPSFLTSSSYLLRPSFPPPIIPAPRS